MRKDLIQGSQEWLDYRQNKIGASDAAAIMGESPWKTAVDLWEEKKGLKEVKVNFAMRQGNVKEEFARADFEARMGVSVTPAVFENDLASWQIASIDGISDDGKIGSEFKCPMSLSAHMLVVAGIVPIYYWIQVQHEMCVVGLDKWYFSSFYEDESEIIEVLRDDSYILKLMKAEYEFYQCMVNDVRPALMQRDCEIIATQEFFTVSERYKDIAVMISSLEDEKENLREDILRIADERNIKGNGLQIKKSIRKGTINYKKVPEDLASQLDQYRAKESEVWRISLVV